MTDMDINRAQILRQQIGRVLRGKHVSDGVGALEMVIVDALSGLPGLDEADTVSAFDAIASDVRNIIRERYAARRKGH